MNSVAPVRNFVLESEQPVPSVRVKNLDSRSIPLRGVDILGSALNRLVGMKLTRETERYAEQYITQALKAYCSHTNAHRAEILRQDITGNAFGAEHVAHDENSDAFSLARQVRHRFVAGRNAWVSDYTFNRDTGTIDVRVNLADISFDAQIGYNDLVFSPVQPGTTNGETFDDAEFLSELDHEFELCGKRTRLKSNLVIYVKTRADYSFLKNYTPAEQRSLDTLREMISEKDFRKYLKYGFILVPGHSGRIYQVFRNSSHTKVWDNGVLTEEICVRLLDAKIPLTDNVIAFKILIEANEEDFRKLGNVYKMNTVACAA